jgi:signal peptide peptidase SppA
MAKEYSRVLRAITERPWNIRRSTLDTMCAIVAARISGVELTKDEIQARLKTEAAARPTQQIIGTVGVIPVFGVLAQKMNMFLDISGGTSYQQLIKQFREFRDDPQVKAIVFEHDSPGGEVFGLVEAAEEIFAARDTKRLIAVVNPLCCSASLFLACACSEIVITPSGEVGCIGTIMCHTDYSKQNEMIGIDPTYIVSSPYKAEGNPDEPLGDDALAYLQSQVDSYGDQFEKFVAKGRNVPVSKVKSDFGQGRVLMARDALKAGLVDRIATMDETIAKLVGRRSAVAGAAAATSPVTSITAGKAKPKAEGEGVPPDENGECQDGYELDENDGLCYPVEEHDAPEARAEASTESDVCTACNGSSLKPERFMSDPQGQEPCSECGGTGKTSARASAATTEPVDEAAQLEADLAYADATIAIRKRS